MNETQTRILESQAAKIQNWNKAKKYQRAGSHVRVNLTGSKDSVSCSICNEELDLTSEIKGVAKNRASVLLRFTRDHFYKHHINASFTKTVDCSRCSGTGIQPEISGSMLDDQPEQQCQLCAGSGKGVVSI